jgi:hypothetical protein
MRHHRCNFLLIQTLSISVFRDHIIDCRELGVTINIFMSQSFNRCTYDVKTYECKMCVSLLLLFTVCPYFRKGHNNCSVCFYQNITTFSDVMSCRCWKCTKTLNSRAVSMIRVEGIYHIVLNNWQIVNKQRIHLVSLIYSN